jgi:hypothetical protein
LPRGHGLKRTHSDGGYGFVQWSLRARRHSPVLRRALVHAVTRARAHGDGAYADVDVLRVTGPVVFTQAVLETMACELERPVGWRDVSGLTTTKRLGGTVVLPVVAFNADKGDREEDRLVRHLFASSWKHRSFRLLPF